MTKHMQLSLPREIVIGKDVLELVSSAMYLDPLTIFREYIQNAVDSIDDARFTGVLGSDEPGRIEISIDLVGRAVKIRDNGLGVPRGEFAERLLAVGGSRKRGSSARGFRGVGRLAGLGYCQELVFRSRAKGEPTIQELRWDCRAFKRLLSDHSYNGSLQDLILAVTSLSEVSAEGWPEHFYEVELQKPIRIKSDLLLNQEAIAHYLSQIAPVPFSPELRFRSEIRSHLVAHLGAISEVDIFIDGAETPIYRPYLNDYAISDTKRDEFTGVECCVIEGLKGGVSAVVWLLHHGYHGAIPTSAAVGGLRARKGNIQIGDPRIFADAFPESRFAAWTVGEVHILDERIQPNGRRDDFEQNAHHQYLVSRLSEVGDHIARMCRSQSIVRNRIKAFEIGATKIDEQLNVVEQGAVPQSVAQDIIGNIRSELFEIGKALKSDILRHQGALHISQRYEEIATRLASAEKSANGAEALAGISKQELEIYQRMIALIYDCSTNRVAAKSLVDRILARIGST